MKSLLHEQAGTNKSLKAAEQLLLFELDSF